MTCSWPQAASPWWSRSRCGRPPGCGCRRCRRCGRRRRRHGLGMAACVAAQGPRPRRGRAGSTVASAAHLDSRVRRAAFAADVARVVGPGSRADHAGRARRRAGRTAGVVHRPDRRAGAGAGGCRRCRQVPAGRGPGPCAPGGVDGRDRPAGKGGADPSCRRGRRRQECWWSSTTRTSNPLPTSPRSSGTPTPRSRYRCGCCWWCGTRTRSAPCSTNTCPPGRGNPPRCPRSGWTTIGAGSSPTPCAPSAAGPTTPAAPWAERGARPGRCGRGTDGRHPGPGRARRPRRGSGPRAGDADRRPRTADRRDPHAREEALEHRPPSKPDAQEEAVLALLLRGPRQHRGRGRRLLQTLPRFRDRDDDDVRDIAIWARLLYPGATDEPWLAPRPDLLRTALLATAIDRHRSQVVAALDDDPRLFLRIARAAAYFPRLADLLPALLTDARLVASSRPRCSPTGLSLRDDLVEALDRPRTGRCRTSNGCSRSPRRRCGHRCGWRCGVPRCGTCARRPQTTIRPRLACALADLGERSAGHRGACRRPRPHPRSRRALPRPRRRPPRRPRRRRSPVSARACGLLGKPTTRSPPPAKPSGSLATWAPPARPRPLPHRASPPSCGTRGRTRKPSRRAARPSSATRDLAAACPARHYPRPRRRPRGAERKPAGARCATTRRSPPRARPSGSTGTWPPTAPSRHGPDLARSPHRPRRRSAGGRRARRGRSPPAARPSSASRTWPPRTAPAPPRLRALAHACSARACARSGRTRRASPRAATPCG